MSISASLFTIASSPPSAALPMAMPVAELLDPAYSIVPPPSDPQSRLGIFGRIARLWRKLGSAAEWLFGVATLVILLAITATIPLVQFLSLGYFLESSARIARSGKFRAGFVGARKAARIGGFLLALGLAWIPLRLIADIRHDALLIDPASKQSRNLNIVLGVAVVLLGVHFYGAFLRGGRLRDFLLPPRPINLWKKFTRPGAFNDAVDAVWNFVGGLQLPRLFWLGARGFAGTLAWLALPVTLLVAGRNLPAVGLLGGLLTALALLYLPFLQVHFALENRLAAMFEVRAVRRHFRRAPLAFGAALILVLALALPLFLLEIEVLPREILWLPTLVFVMLMWPARLLVGWAYSRAVHHEQPRWFGSRWLSRFAILPAALFYALILFFTQYIAWYGALNLYFPHPLLMPVPLLGY